jgi:outer membrane protein TolC
VCIEVFASVRIYYGSGLANCSPVQQNILKPIQLANDPSSLAPASPSAAWSQADAAAIPDGKTTLNSFANRGPMPLPPIDHERVYDLSALIDLAQRSNPETRADWDAARAAAAKLGISEGAYLPTMSAVATASNAQLCGAYCRSHTASASGLCVNRFRTS